MFEPGNAESSMQSEEMPQRSSSVSEISHLFLSSVRDQAASGPRPHRRPPGKHVERPSASIDLSPEEFSHVFTHEDALRLDAILDGDDEEMPATEVGGEASHAPAVESVGQHEKPTRGPIAVVLASHFGSRQLERVRHYARHLAAGNKRVGLIEVDTSEFRLFCFDGHAHSAIECSSETSSATEVEAFDGRQMADALNEMSWDVEHWLLALSSPRLPESKTLLHAVSQWTLLTTADHDGVVSAYRTMKGLSEDLDRAGLTESIRPRVSLAVVDSDETTTERVYRKIAGVCEEFLGWPIEREGGVWATETPRVSEHVVMCCHPTRDKAQLALGTQWQVVEEFLEHTKEETKPAVDPAMAPVRAIEDAAEEPVIRLMPAEPLEPESIVSPEESKHFKEPLPETPAMSYVSSKIMSAPIVEEKPVMTMSQNSDDVIELVGNDTNESAIIASVMQNGIGAGQFVECPIAPPMRSTAKLAVTRDRRITLIAVARQGLSDLRTIGQAYRWLVENRALIAMAMPQMSIDAHAMPHLNVLIDQSDTTADLLQPLLSAGHVTVRTYRKLRWGGKTGLLLEAA